MNAVRCSGVCKSFGGVHALNDVNLVLPASGIIALIGPNGAGKSTLLNVWTGLCRADAGECFIGETEISNLSVDRIARLGVSRAFQELRLITQVSAMENLLMAFPHQRGELLTHALTGMGVSNEESRHSERARQILKQIGLDAVAGQVVGELSYGQQKLLSVGCCVASGARILLLDEPVAGIHPNAALHLFDILMELRNQQKLIVFIEHDLWAVRKLAEYVFVMDAGRIVAEGIPAEILESREVVDAYLG